MVVTRNDGWLQRALYVMMAVLGVYIIYKSGTILIKNRSVRPVSGTGVVQKNVEDAAVRTLAPGYAAAVEGKGREGWVAGLMEPLVPVYSYMAEHQKSAAQDESESGDMLSDDFKETGEGGAESAAGPGSGEASSEGGDSGDSSEKGEDPDGNDASGSEDFTEDDGPGEQAWEAFGNKNGISLSLLRELADFDRLLSGYYTLDEGTTVDGNLLDAPKLLAKDLSLAKDGSVPQILIYHTHSQEAFADSREGNTDDSIVGMGEVLAELLRNRYGYQVIHDTGVYDLVDGVLDRSAAYDYAREAVERILEENPTVEVVIDLHRDGVDGYKFATEIDGKPTSMIMFFNGLSQDASGKPIAWLENPYLEDNLAFSLQLQLLARQQYPDFTRNIYLKAERFNLHLRARSLLIEAGTQLNTVEEEKNAMEPLASLLAQVLAG